MNGSDPIPPKMLILLEWLPACGMNFRRAAVKAGYTTSYARKIVGRFARDAVLQGALRKRIERLLAEAGASDRAVVERVLQREHFRHHPISGSFVTGRHPSAAVL
jgi:hypothetical protein